MCLQNQSLAAANQAATALSAIQGLASMQAAAQQALANAVQQQVTAIKSATFAKIITITQALSLWKKVRDGHTGVGKTEVYICPFL